MAKRSICALVLIASIVSVVFHMPGVDADDAQNDPVTLGVGDLPLVGENLADPPAADAPAAIPLEDLAPLPEGEFEDFGGGGFDFGFRWLNK